MNSSIYIPKRINVGFQDRRGTYTGKLAYIIYWDEKNKLRKETSWNNWRDHNIEPQDFDNEPTEGFVLNKKVGDYDSGWNHRHAYCRVYDPRGFEFEITIENLLYILENATSTKGKGLEGEFIYGWDGKDLVLLPVDSPDYKEIQSYTEIISTNNIIKQKDLVIGRTYADKIGRQLVYLGKHPYYYWGYKYRNADNEIVKVKKIKDIPNEIVKAERYKDTHDVYMGEYMWFASPYDYCEGKRCNYTHFERYKGMPKKFIKVTNTMTYEFFDELIESMKGTIEYSPLDKTGSKAYKYSFEQFEQLINSKHMNSISSHYGIYSITGYQYLVKRDKENKELFSVEPVKSNIESLIEYVEPPVFKYYGRSDETVALHKRKYTEDFNNRFEGFIEYNTESNEYYYGGRIPSNDISYKHATNLSIQQVYDKLEPCYIVDYLENGKAYRQYGDYLKLSGVNN